MVFSYLGVNLLGEAVIGGDNKQQKKNGAADGRNRRALNDIGNLVPARGEDVKPNRPITRCSLLYDIYAFLVSLFLLLDLIFLLLFAGVSVLNYSLTHKLLLKTR